MILRRLRKGAKSIHWFVIVTFIGSIFLVWGMQYGVGVLRARSVAIVEGTQISSDEFSLMYERSYRLYRNIDEDFDPARFKLRERVLDEAIQQRLLRHFAKRLGHGVTPEEIAARVRARFPDEPSYMQYIQTMPAFILRAEEAVATDEVLSDKARFTLAALTSVSDLEVKYFFIENFESAKISHILIKPGELVPLRKREEFYNKNKDLFKKPGDTKVSRIVLIKREGVKEDERVSMIMDKLNKKEATFEELLEQYSEDLYTKERKGEVGTLTEEIVEEFIPEYDVIFDSEVGDIVGPVETKDAFHILRIDGKATPTTRQFFDKKTQDKIKEFFKEEYIDEAKALAYKLYERVKAGESFEALVQEYSHARSRDSSGYIGIIPKRYLLEVKEEQIKLWKDEITDGFSIPSELTKAVFGLRTATVTEPFLTEFGYHIVKVHEYLPCNWQYFTENKATMTQLCLAEKRQMLLRSWLQDRLEKAKIKKID